MRRIQELMSKKTQSITPQTRLIDASRLMAHQNVAMLPVNVNGQMRGVLTEHDIVSQVFAQGKDFKEILAQEVMSPKNYYCYTSEDVEEAIDRMEDKHVSCLFVLDEQDRLVGELHSHQLEEAVEEVELERETQGLVSGVQRRFGGSVDQEDLLEIHEMERYFKPGDVKLSDLILHAIQGREKKAKMRRVTFLVSSVIFFVLSLLWLRQKVVQATQHES